MSGSQGHYHSNCNPGRAHHTLGLSSLKACSPRLAGPLKSSGAAPAEALHRWCYMARNTSPRAQGPEDAAQDSVLPWDRQRLGGHRTAMTFLPLCSPELCRSATLPPQHPDPYMLRAPIVIARAESMAEKLAATVVFPPGDSQDNKPPLSFTMVSQLKQVKQISLSLAP